MTAALPSTVLAQASQSGQVEQSVEKKDQAPAERLERELPQVNVENRPELKSSGSVKMLVTHIKITGCEIYSEASLRSLIEDAEGREWTLDELKAWADQITLYYRRKGYGAAWAYIPVQAIRSGEIEIAVVEAKAGKILVSGNKHFTSSFILSHMAGLLNQDALDLDALEKGLYNLNDYPGLRVTATLRPGDGPGLSDVYLNATDKGPVLVTFDYDNYGSEFIATSRFGATVTAVNVAELGHNASLRVLEGDGDGSLTYFRLGYTVPFGWGPRISAYGSHFEFDAGGDLSLLEPAGTGDVFGVTASYPVVRNHIYSLIPEVGFEYKDLTQELLGTTSAEDKLRVLVLGLQFEWNDDFYGRWAGSFQYRKGMPGYMGGSESVDPDASRAGGGGDFTKWSFIVYRLQKVVWWAHLIVKFQYQASDDLLVVSEQFAGGGSDSIRGYSPFELMGDKGYVYTVEARFKMPFLADDPIVDQLQFAVFYDKGQIERNDSFLGATPKEVRAGAGFGIRYQEERWGSARLDIGWNTTPEDPAVGRSPIVYLSVIINVN